MGGRHHWWGVRYRTTGRPFTINRGVCSCARVFVLCCICVVCLCRVFVSRLFVCLFVLCVLCVLCVVCSSAELRNFVLLVVFLPYQIPYLSSTGLSRVLVLLADYGQPASPPLFNSSAELRNFVFGCFLPYQTPYLSSTGPLAWWDLLISKILPPNIEYGPLACFGPTRTTACQPPIQ
jgi:hypothetical protein